MSAAILTLKERIADVSITPLFASNFLTIYELAILFTSMI